MTTSEYIQVFEAASDTIRRDSTIRQDGTVDE